MVRDTDGRPIESVTVMIKTDGLGDEFEFLDTDQFAARGEGRIRLQLPAGRYQVVVLKAGYGPASTTCDSVEGQVSEVALALRPDLE